MHFFGLTVEYGYPALLASNGHFHGLIIIKLAECKSPSVFEGISPGLGPDVHVPFSLITSDISSNIDLGGIGVDHPQESSISTHSQFGLVVSVQIAHGYTVGPSFGPLGMGP